MSWNSSVCLPPAASTVSRSRSMETRGGSIWTGAGCGGRELGCAFSINHDAHSTEEIAFFNRGILGCEKYLYVGVYLMIIYYLMFDGPQDSG
jgi:hypothetical protein